MINYKIHYTGEKIDELLDIVNGNINIKAIRTDAQQLSDSQKAQARQNIGAIDETRAGEIDEEVKETQELLAPVQETYIASKNYSIGEFLVLENKLYKVVDSIDSGETIVVDGNVVEASIGNEIVGINERIDDVEDAILAKREESAVATKNYLVGELLILEDVLYRVTTNIASGEAIAVGTNVVATSVAEELAALDEKKANTSGVYDDLTSGQSKQLIATVGTEDKEPYLFRSSGGSIDVGDRKEEEFIGGTIAWNQLLRNGNFAEKSEWIANNPSFGDYTVSDNVATLTVYAPSVGNTSVYFRNTSPTAKIIIGHVYLGIICVNPSRSTYVRYMYSNVASGTRAKVCPAESWTVVANIIKCTADANGALFYYNLSNAIQENDIIKWKDAMSIDLTQMFGTTIADYIYSLETSTPGAGVAWFRKLFPKAYYPYDAGTLRSVQFSAHETIGFNAFDPSTGTAKLLGGNQYQISGTYTSLAYENLDGESETITPDENGHFTPEKNGILTVTGGNGSDTCVHLVWSGYRDGEWEAFEKHQYEVEEVELRGIPQIDGNGSLCWDGDRYKSGGMVTRRYYAVNTANCSMGTYSGTRWTMLLPSSAPDIKYVTPGTVLEGYNSGGFTWKPKSEITNNIKYAIAESDANARRRFMFTIDSDIITTGAEMQKWMNAHPFWIVYPVDVPTTESASPYTNPQIINDFGTEEFLDTREVPIPVGHETFYAANLRDKLQHLPDLASSNGKYLVSQNGTQMELVAPQTDSTLSLEGEFADAKATGDAIHDTQAMIAGRETTTTATKNYSIGDLVIVSDTLYRVTAAIATGETITPGTNVTADTVAAELAALDADKADKVGEAPDLTSGNARQLLSTVGITEQVPYNFRTSGGSLEIGDRETDEIVGGTVAWNQNIAAVMPRPITNGITRTQVEGISEIALRIYGTSTISTNYTISGNIRNYTPNHVYYITLGNVNIPAGSRLSFVDQDRGTCVILRFTSLNAQAVNLYIASGTEIDVILYPQAFDLTAMFGTTIADYVYSLDRSTPGAGVAWFRKLFPNGYYAYDPGTLRSVKTSAKKTVGFNQFIIATKTDNKGIAWSTGTTFNDSGSVVSDFIRATDAVYYTNYMAGCFAYDSNLNYIGALKEGVWIKSFGQLTNIHNVSGAYYIKFWFRSSANGDVDLTAKTDINVNFRWDGERDGEYEPYEIHTYALDPIDLRGIPKLDTNNNLHYDGDRYKSDGTVERGYGIVDLGTLTWIKYSDSYPAMYTTIQGISYLAGNRVHTICNRYISVQDNGNNGGFETDRAMPDKSIRVSAKAANRVYIYDSAYTDAASFKAAMSGVYLVYELATPATETAAPYTNPQNVDNWGTEEYIDADVASGDRDMSIPVGHVTEYLQDLRSKIETAPNSPDADGTYLIRRENGENSYILFSEPEAQKALSEIEILAQIADGVYQGVDLTTKFASEISGDPWAWIQGRIQAGDFSGIHVNDWIPFTTMESTPRTYKACVGGINMYKGYGDTAIGNHIDFICRELWYTRHSMNPVVYNNGTKFGDAEATEYPWLASDLYLWLNSLSGKVPNAIKAGGGTGTDVDYTSDGVYYYLPAALKNVIVEKRAYLPKRYSASGLLADDNSGGWENIGKLWLPSEWEVYGGPVRGGLRDYSVLGNCIQYPIFQSMTNRVKNRSGSRDGWWLLSVGSGNAMYWCLASYYGIADRGLVSSANAAVPVCFRIS